MAEAWSSEPCFRPGPFFENEARWREHHLHSHDYRHVHLYVMNEGCSVPPMGVEMALFRHDRPGRDHQSTCGAGSVLAYWSSLYPRWRGGGPFGKLAWLPSLNKLMDLPPPLHVEGGVNISAYPTDRTIFLFGRSPIACSSVTRGSTRNVPNAAVARSTRM